MIYGYVRASTDRQDTENQKIGILDKAKFLNVEIDEWIADDGVSGAKEPDKRMLGPLLDKLKKGDVVVVSNDVDGNQNISVFSHKKDGVNYVYSTIESDIIAHIGYSKCEYFIIK